jgi:hypothetical protein
MTCISTFSFGFCRSIADIPAVKWSKFQDVFSGSNRNLHRCIVHPLNVGEFCGVDNEIHLNICNTYSKTLKSLIKEYNNIFDTLAGYFTKSRADAADIQRSIKSLREMVSESPNRCHQILHEAQQINTLMDMLETEFDLVLAEDLSKTAGQKGWVHDKFLDSELPLLKGCLYWDEICLNEVPCLSIVLDPDSSKYSGLGCTVLDPILGQVIPATIGGRMRSPGSGDVVPINGVRKDAVFNVVVPFSNIDGQKASSTEIPTLFEDILRALPRFDLQMPKEHLQMPEVPTKLGELSNESRNADAVGKVLSKVELGILNQESESSRRIEAVRSMADKESQTSDSSRPSSKQESRLAAHTLHDSNLPIKDPSTLKLSESADHAQLSPASMKTDARGDFSTREMSTAEAKRSFPELLESALLEFSGEGQSEDIVQIAEHTKELIQEKYEIFKQTLGQQKDAFDHKHADMLNLVRSSSMGDEEEKAKLIADMEQQKRFMDEIVAQELARQMSLFERAQIEAAERRMRRAQKLVQQHESEAAASFGNLSTAQRAAQRMQLDMENALEDRITEEVSQAAKQRTALISIEQIEVLEALAGAAGAPNSDDIMEQLLARYESDVDDIETRVRQTLADSISALSTKMEVDLARKMARLRVKTEKARAEKLWRNVRLMVRMGAWTNRRASNSQALVSVAEARHQQQRQRLIAALDAQDKLETQLFTDSLSISQSRQFAEAESAFAAQLAAVTNEKERDRMIKDHQVQMDALKQQDDRERLRQLDDLNQRLQHRRKRIQEQEAYHREEIELLSSPQTVKQAELVGAKTETVIKQEQERAYLLQALEQEAKLEQDELVRILDVEAMVMTLEKGAEFDRSLSSISDEGQRKGMMASHEAELEALRRQQSIEKCRQLEELHNRIAQRKSRQINKQESLHHEVLNLLSSPDTVDQAESLGLTTAAISRQEQQRVQLLSSLEALSGAERVEVARAVDVSINQEIAEKESLLLSRLDAVDDVDARAQLLRKHESEMDALRKKLEVDKQRQLSALEERCKIRKQKKLEQDLTQMQEEELKKITSPETSKEAEMIGLTIDVILKQEMGAANLHAAIAEQNAMELQVVQGNLDAQRVSSIANAKAQLSNQLVGKDDKERDRLIAIHEIDIARIRAEAAMTKAKAQDDLHHSLQERKDKKRLKLEQQHQREMDLLSHAENKESAVKAIEPVILESLVDIEHEKKAAKMMYNVVSESQSEVKLLRDELNEKSAQIIQNEEAKLVYEMSHLDPTSSEREILLQVCISTVIISHSFSVYTTLNRFS